MTQEDVLENVFAKTETKNLISGMVWTNGEIINEDFKKSLWISASKPRQDKSGKNVGYLRISVCPPKFIKGNNIEEASIRDTLDLFTMLSNMVGYDLGETAKVDKIDITHTAMTEYAPVAYYPFLCNQTGKENQRWIFDSTLYYGANKAKQKKFYDKVKEAHKTGGLQHIPIEYSGQNMTRFEVGLGTHKRVSDVLGEFALLGHLFTEEYIMKLHSYWRSEYSSIPKKTEIDTNFKQGMKQKDVQDEIIKAALTNYGRLRIEDDIERAAKMGALSYSAKSRAKNKLLLPFESNGVNHSLIEELDEKIMRFEPIWE